jgi:probable F420-dependent oxidoreductase
MRSLRFGLWYDFRNPPQWPQDPTVLYRRTLESIVKAEELGWDDVWLSEHHFVDDGYCPSVLPLASAIAARTERIRIGTSVLLLPLHDPLRVAEDAAAVDILSGGRLELGVGAGYRREEFEGFAVPRSERGQRMEEAVRILRRLFAAERFSFDGRHYRYGEICLRPLPVQRPVPLWMGAFSSVAVKRAARLGCHYVAIGPIRPLVDLYRQELRRQGRDPEAFEVAGGYPWLLVARDPQRRWREAREHFSYQIGLYARWFSEAGMSIAREARSDEDLQRQGIFILGPEEAIERIRDYVETNGVTRFYGWTVPPGLPPDWSDEHLELMAREVIPEFR